MHEEEQIQAIKDWWKQNGSRLITIVIVVLVAFYGSRLWMDKQKQLAETASAYYQTLMISLQENKMDEVKTQAQNLVDNFSKTPYAEFAALFLAKIAVEENDLAKANEHLTWILAQANKEEPISHIARTRLGRVLFAQGEYAAIHDLFNKVGFGVYSAVYQEILGDTFAAEGKITEAKAAYAKALASPQLEQSNNSLVEMKLNNLPAGAAKEE